MLPQIANIPRRFALKSIKGFFIAMAAAGALSLAVAPGALAEGGAVAGAGYRRLKPPDAYGAVIMDKNTKDSKTVRPVVFPHWIHRMRYSCKACHTDMAVPLKAGSLDIKQSDIEAGRHCGKCHDGKEAFGASECDRCHAYGSPSAKNAKMEERLKDLPRDEFGNRVNWVKAVRDGKMQPKGSMAGGALLEQLDKDIVIPAIKYPIHPPDVLFPHKAHTEVLECANCHTGIFNPKQGGNPDMNMLKIISGQYCGACHGRVAFPLEDCFRCHSQPPQRPEEPKKDDAKKDDVKKEEPIKK